MTDLQDSDMPVEPSADGLSLVVAIGASAGGIAVLRPLLKLLDKDAPVAYLLLQHTDPNRMKELQQVLATESALPIDLAGEGSAVQAGRVLLMPTDEDFEIHDGVIHLLSGLQLPGARHSIDHAMNALAEAYGPRGVGIILTGSGMDGTQGMRAIRAAGGITMVQDPVSAEYPSMPEAVIGGGLADFILGPEAIPAELARVLQWKGAEAPVEEEGDSLEPLLRLVQRTTGFDFQQYKEGTLRRRLARRMLVNRCETLAAYRTYLSRHPEEADTLVRDLLISVTNFFRDAEIFSTLEKVLRPKLEGRESGETIRVWVPGCATGEEPYSLAIVLAELLGERLGQIKVQIFATDVDSAAIREARQATYRAESVRAIPQALLDKYFDPWDSLFRVRRDVRDMVVFAEHDLIHDPPFTRLDLVSCRNVLIYFKHPLQEQLLANFHYALRPDGLLLLGSSESADRFTRLFSRADESAKLYRRNEVEGLPPARMYRRNLSLSSPRERAPTRIVSPEERTRQLLMQSYLPGCALANSRQDLVYTHGDVSRYLRLPQGALNLNLVEMAASPEIRVELRLVLNRVARDRARTVSHLVSLPDGSRQLRMVGLPDEDDHVLVVFEDVEPPAPPDTVQQSAAGDAARRAAELEKELAATREHLNANIEELEASNEELQSMNEEHQSTTEELQSTLEEYQTTNEELQSTNEELNTVNDELNAKSDALELVNEDLQGILDNVASAIIVLDRNLHVTRYSAASKQIFDLWPTTIGRPFIGVGGALDLAIFSTDIQEAVRERKPVQRNLTLGQTPYDVRIIPRLDNGRGLAGMIIVFTDASTRLAASEQATLLAAVLADSNDALVVHRMDGRILAWNAGARRMLGYGTEEVVGQPVELLLPEAARVDYTAMGRELGAGQASLSIETRWRAKDGREVEVWLTASLLRDDQGAPYAIAITARDIADRNRAVQSLSAAKEAAEISSQVKTRFLAAASHDLRQPMHSMALYLAVALSEVGSDRRLEALRKLGLALTGLKHSLEGLLDTTRLDAGEIVARPEVFPLNELFERVCAQASGEAEQRGLRLRCVPTRVFVRSDPRLLEVVLCNLMFNAVKYTSSGGVVLGCRRRGGKLWITVCDSGPGIAERHRQEIFEEFVRLPSARVHGLGLGLAIVRRVVDLLDHTLELRSMPGRGSCFSLQVPRAAAEEMTDRPAPLSPGRLSGRVMVLDDDAAVRDSTRLLLEIYGLSVSTAKTLEEALACASKQPPDLLIVDYRLDGDGADDADGLAAARQLRETVGRRDLPVLVLTGETQSEIAERVAAAGYGMLTKPVDTAELLRLIQELLAAKD